MEVLELGETNEGAKYIEVSWDDPVIAADLANYTQSTRNLPFPKYPHCRSKKPSVYRKKQSWEKLKKSYAREKRP